MLGSTEFHAALAGLGFSILVLAIQLPLGIYIALKLPFEGLLSKFYIIIFAIPLLMPGSWWATSEVFDSTKNRALSEFIALLDGI